MREGIPPGDEGNLVTKRAAEVIHHATYREEGLIKNPCTGSSYNGREAESPREL